jgi:hypothetical protein
MDEKKYPKRALDEEETNDKKMHRKYIHTQWSKDTFCAKLVWWPRTSQILIIL